jgi:acetylornithine deacetylase/succinyl-diaminopimelate desuccinylase-like protein
MIRWKSVLYKDDFEMNKKINGITKLSILAIMISLNCGVTNVHAQNAHAIDLPLSQKVARDVLRDLVAAQAVGDRGTLQSAKFLEQVFLKAGFAKEDVQILAPKAHPNKANLIVRLRGKNLAKPIMYIGHLDVVEAKREDWNFDPFVLTEHEGWLYGRGTIDMLGQISALVANFLRLKQEGFIPERDLMLALTADEETETDANGVAWLLKEHRSLMDVAMVINPDAGESALKHGKHYYQAIQTSEKIYLDFKLEALDKGGHSSRPTQNNPIYRLSRGLDKLSKYDFPLHLTDTVRAYFLARANLESGQKKKDMQAIATLKQGQIDAKVIQRLSGEVETNIMLRTTCTTTLVSGGHAENALPQRAFATVQCRVIPGESQAYVQNLIKNVIQDKEIQISVLAAAKPSPETPPSVSVRTKVESVSHQLWPGLQILPLMSPGATDNVYTRLAGIPTYGIDAMFDDLDDGRAHGRDERIGVKVFNQEVEFFYRLMKAMDTLPR